MKKSENNEKTQDKSEKSEKIQIKKFIPPFTAKNR